MLLRMGDVGRLGACHFAGEAGAGLDSPNGLGMLDMS